MNRTQWILSGVLLLQLLLLVVVKAPFSGESDGASVRPLLPELESFSAARLRIEDAEAQAVELELTGDAWTLPEAGHFPVDGTKVAKLLADLEDLKVRRPVVSSGRYHEALKVSEGEHERRVQLWEDPADDPEIDLFVGTSPNYRISHARVAGDDRVYEVMGLSAWDLRADAASWIEKKLVDIPADEVIRLNVSNEHGSFSLEKKQGEWLLASASTPAPEGKTLSQTEVDSLARAFASVFLADPVGAVDDASHGFTAPAATVEIVRGREEEPVTEEEAVEAEAGETEAPAEGAAEEAIDEPAAPRMVELATITLTIGGEVDAESGKRYATRTDFSYTVTLSKFDAERATGKKLEDLYTE
jgi:hypothetical protein